MRDSDPVWVADRWAKTPTYHRLVTAAWSHPACGAPSWPDKSGKMRLDHARKIGRPCKKCWPEGDD